MHTEWKFLFHDAIDWVGMCRFRASALECQKKVAGDSFQHHAKMSGAYVCVHVCVHVCVAFVHSNAPPLDSSIAKNEYVSVFKHTCMSFFIAKAMYARTLSFPRSLSTSLTRRHVLRLSIFLCVKAREGEKACTYDHLSVVRKGELVHSLVCESH